MNGDPKQKGWLAETFEIIMPWDELDHQGQNLVWICLSVSGASLSLIIALGLRYWRSSNETAPAILDILAFAFIGLALAAIPSTWLCRSNKTRLIWGLTATAVFMSLVIFAGLQVARSAT